jgi:hypothetical protein
MSAVEVIEEIRRLPREEQQKVSAYLRAAEPSSALPAAHDGVSEEFKRLADEVFTTNAELFRKLAQ